jgi:hypothetical protein
MATHDWVTGYTGYSTEHEISKGMVGYLYRYFDTSSTNMTGSDVYQIFKVGNGVMPVNVYAYVATVEGGAATLDIGDGASTARYETDADINAAGVTKSLDATTVYTGDDTIDIIPSATLNAAKFWVVIEYIRLTT